MADRYGPLEQQVRHDAAQLLRAAAQATERYALPELAPMRWQGTFRYGEANSDLGFEIEPAPTALPSAPEIAGFGIFRVAGREPVAAIVSYRLEVRGRSVPLHESPEIAATIEPIRRELASDPIVLGLPPPVSNVGCGSELWAGNPGTAGPLVKRQAVVGLLTAGHVAPSVGTMAYLEGTAWGTVRFTTDGTQNPADVAFVQRTDPTAPAPRCPQPNLTTRPGLGALVESFGALNCRSGNVLGIMPFQWFPVLGRNLAEIMVTAQPLSAPGDSGALVTQSSSGDMVGLIVGSDQKAETYSSVQLAEYSLPAAGCTL